MKLSASNFNEKTVFIQFQKQKSQISAVHTGVHAYMVATPLPVQILGRRGKESFHKNSEEL